MANKSIKLDKKELLIAAGAAMTLGLGTTIGHNVVVHAATTDNTSTQTTNPSTSEPTNTDSSTSNTNNSNNTSNTTSNSTSDQTSNNLTSTTNTKTVTPVTTTTINPVAPVVTNSTNTSTTNSVASSTTTPTATTIPAVTATNSDVATQPTTNSTPTTQSVSSNTSTGTTTTTSGTAPTTTPVTSVQPGTLTPQATSTPVSTTTPTMTPVDTSIYTVTDSSDYTPAGGFNWSTDDTTGNATLSGTNSQFNSADINVPTTITVTKNGTTTSKDYNVTTIGNSAFVGLKTVDSVKINSGLTTIDDGAFAYSTLKNVDLSDADSLTTIGNQAFVSDQLKTVDLPSEVTSIGDQAFAYNPDLTDVDFSKATGLNNIGSQAFAADSSLSGIDLSNNNQLTNISDEAFVYDSGATSLKLPDSIKSIGNSAFLATKSLSSVTFGPNIVSIGTNAFTYDTGLKTVDFSKDNALTTIGDGAFEYGGLTGTLTLPANLLSVGNSSFTGNGISTLNLDNKLQTIGDSAFGFNHLQGTLLIPASVQTVGQSGFISNLLTGVSDSSGTVNLGTNAFTQNRITNISMPNLSLKAFNANFQVGVGQLATIFTDSAHNNISDFFNVNIGGLTEKDMEIIAPTQGVTYNNGIFTIPAGTTQFQFGWKFAPDPDYDEGYSGYYTVNLDDPAIKLINSSISTGTTWDPADNFVSAVNSEGSNVPINDMNIFIQDENNQPVSTLDTTKTGYYAVTYSYGNESQTAYVYVNPRAGYYTLSGQEVVHYNAQTQTPDPSQFTIQLSDGTPYTLTSGDIEAEGLTPDSTTNDYKIVLTQQGLDNIEKLPQSNLYTWSMNPSSADFLIEKQPVEVIVNNVSIINGDPLPTFTSSVVQPSNIPDDKWTAPVYTYHLTPIPTGSNQVGNYTIYIMEDDANYPNYSIYQIPGELSILPNKKSISGNNYTMTVGGTKPTVTDFEAAATDKYGNTEAVSADLSKVNFDVAGDYPVDLTTADGQTKAVSLTLSAPVVTPPDNTGNTGNTTSGTTTGSTTTGTKDPSSTTTGSTTTGTKDPSDTTTGSTTTGTKDPSGTTTDGTTTGTKDPSGTTTGSTTTDPKDPSSSTTSGTTDPSDTSSNTTTGTTTTDPSDPTNNMTDPNDAMSDSASSHEVIAPLAPPETKPDTSSENMSKDPEKVADSKNSTLNSDPVETPKHNVIMSGEVYYIPNNNHQSAGVLVAPKQTYTATKYQPAYSANSGVATFPQTGNDSGTLMKILGFVIGILTLGVIDIKKNHRHA